MLKIYNRLSSCTLTFVLILTIFCVSIPTHKSIAGSLGIGATEPTALRTAASSAISAVADTTNAVNSTSLVLKENVLDGIGWAIAKQMVSSMTASLLNWINSGFEGSPAFITDLNGFLLDALDTAAGEYIKSLGGVGEFICSPFKLDIQATLSVAYAQARSGLPSGPTAPACKLTDIQNNIEGFFAGITDGGWNEWLQVTSDPQNTPYGAYLEAQARLKIKLRNDAGQELEIANWGDGFLSKKICESIEGTNGGERCTISTPGQVISEALTFQLSTGPRALIEADEINEIIGALLNQLTLKAMEGINGLLGLSEGTGYTDYTLNGTSTKSYTDGLIAESYLNTTIIKKQMDESLVTERGYLTLASSTLSEASRRLGLVSSGVNAMANLFSGTNPGARLANLNKSDNLRTARTKINDEFNSSVTASERTNLEAAQAELTKIDSALSVIAATSDRNLGSDLTTISFTQLEAEAVAIVSELSSLVSELSSIVPTVRDNVNKLTSMINRYETAVPITTRTGTSSAETVVKSAAAIQNDIALEYASLLTGNRLTSQIVIDQNRIRWNQKLRQ
jgi:hypothetical protein